MTAPDDPQLVDYLYDELTSEEASRFERLLADDAEARLEVESLDAALESLRSGLPAEDPSPQLDAKILAYARQAAEKQSEQSLLGKLRKLLRSPTFGLVAAGSLALIAGFVIMPQMKRSEPNYDAYSVAVEAQRGPVPAMAPAPVTAPASAPVEALAEAPKLEEKKAEASKEVAAQRAEPELARKKAKAASDLEGWEAEQEDSLADGRRANRAPAKAPAGAAAGPAANKVVARFDAPKDEALPEPTPLQQKADKGGTGDSLASGESVGGKREANADAPSKNQPMTEEAADDAVDRSERRSRGDEGLAKAREAPASAAPAPAADPAPVAGVALSPPAPSRAASARAAAPREADAGPAPATLIAMARQTAPNGDTAATLKLLQRATALARGRPEEGNILLDAADIALALREPATAEQYARAAERLPNFGRVADARRTAAKARVMRTQSPKATTKTTY